MPSPELETESMLKDLFQTTAKLGIKAGQYKMKNAMIGKDMKIVLSQ